MKSPSYFEQLQHQNHDRSHIQQPNQERQIHMQLELKSSSSYNNLPTNYENRADISPILLKRGLKGSAETTTTQSRELQPLRFFEENKQPGQHVSNNIISSPNLSAKLIPSSSATVLPPQQKSMPTSSQNLERRQTKQLYMNPDINFSIIDYILREPQKHNASSQNLNTTDSNNQLDFIQNNVQVSAAVVTSLPQPVSTPNSSQAIDNRRSSIAAITSLQVAKTATDTNRTLISNLILNRLQSKVKESPPIQAIDQTSLNLIEDEMQYFSRSTLPNFKNLKHSVPASQLNSLIDCEAISKQFFSKNLKKKPGIIFQTHEEASPVLPIPDDQTFHLEERYSTIVFEQYQIKNTIQNLRNEMSQVTQVLQQIQLLEYKQNNPSSPRRQPPPPPPKSSGGRVIRLKQKRKIPPPPLYKIEQKPEYKKKLEDMTVQLEKQERILTEMKSKKEQLKSELTEGILHNIRCPTEQVNLSRYVKKLLKLKVKVTQEMLPRFLPANTAEYLIEVANLELKLDHTHATLQDHTNNVVSKYSDSSSSMSLVQFSKQRTPAFIQNIKKKIAGICQQSQIMGKNSDSINTRVATMRESDQAKSLGTTLTGISETDLRVQTEPTLPSFSMLNQWQQSSTQSLGQETATIEKESLQIAARLIEQQDSLKNREFNRILEKFKLVSITPEKTAEMNRILRALFTESEAAEFMRIFKNETFNLSKSPPKIIFNSYTSSLQHHPSGTDIATYINDNDNYGGNDRSKNLEDPIVLKYGAKTTREQQFNRSSIASQTATPVNSSKKYSILLQSQARGKPSFESTFTNKVMTSTQSQQLPRHLMSTSHTSTINSPRLETSNNNNIMMNTSRKLLRIDAENISLNMTPTSRIGSQQSARLKTSPNQERSILKKQSTFNEFFLDSVISPIRTSQQDSILGKKKLGSPISKPRVSFD